MAEFLIGATARRRTQPRVGNRTAGRLKAGKIDDVTGGAERAAAIRVAIVDDDPWAMSKLAEFLDGLDDMVVLDTCISVDALLAGPGSSADVVVLDAQLRFDPVVVENVRRAGQHGARVLLVSAYFDEQDLRGALGAGAAGFSPKVGSFASSADAIRAVVAGQAVLSRETMLAALNNPSPSAPRLAPREIDVLALSSTGLTARAVARHLGIAEDTVKETSRRSVPSTARPVERSIP